MNPSPSAAEAARILRDGTQFEWYVIPLFALTVYVYANEIERRNWNLVFAGLAFWGMDWINETWNSLIFHFTGYAPAWAAPGKTAYLILIGLNVEICFMFAVAGVAFAKMLPADKGLRIFGVPNRLFVAVAGSIFCVVVEMWLNAVGALTWDHAWWNRGAPWLIFLLGYFPFFVVSFWVYDMNEIRRQSKVVGAIYAVAISALVIFGSLGWL